jgi:maltose O-acetyltransferase
MFVRRVKIFIHHEFGGIDPCNVGARLMASPLPDYFCSGLRTQILRTFGFKVGPDTFFWGMPRMIGGPGLHTRLAVGCDTRFNIGCILDLYGYIKIGDHVSFGPQVLILTGEHEIGDSERRIGALSQATVTIGDGCWIGARATILPGVTISAGSVVAAGAVVTHDVPPNTVVGGVPAKVLRTLDPLEVTRLLAISLHNPEAAERLAANSL